MNPLAWLGQRATAALAVGVLLGLVVPGFSEFLPPFLPTLVFIFTAVSFLKVDFTALRLMISRPAFPSLLLVWILVFSPLVVALALGGLSIDRELSRALIVWAVSPPMTAAIVFAAFLRLNVALAAGVSLMGILVVPFTGPVLSVLLSDLSIDVDPIRLVLRVCTFVGFAAGVALMLRRVIGGRVLANFDSEISGIIVIFLLLYATTLMSSVRGMVLENISTAALYVAVAYAANIGVQLLTAIVFMRSNMNLGATAALLAGNRNMGVMYASIGVAITPGLELFFAAIHIPIYTLPYLLKSIYFRSIASETLVKKLKIWQKDTCKGA